MPANYFYGPQAEQFAFYRIPKALFTASAYRGISTDAKVLYGLLLDRMSLSARNDWLDEQGRVYIIFTVEEVMDALCCADNKATRLLRELEGVGLIERKRRGLGKPSLIYVKNFAEVPEQRIKNRENHDSVPAKTATLEAPKSRSNKTDKNNTDLSETNPFPSDEGDGVAAGMEAEGNDTRARYQEYFVRQSNFDALIASYPDDEDMLREMLELLVDTVCSRRRFIRIAGDDKPAEVVKARLLKLDGDHLRFVLMCLKENTTLVRNMRQYLLAALYNAPLTMSNYYSARVQHDMKTE